MKGEGGFPPNNIRVLYTIFISIFLIYKTFSPFPSPIPSSSGTDTRNLRWPLDVPTEKKYPKDKGLPNKIKHSFINFSEMVWVSHSKAHMDKYHSHCVHHKRGSEGIVMTQNENSVWKGALAGTQPCLPMLTAFHTSSPMWG